MKAEIITIGDEILIGQIVNTNSVWIAQQLNLIGIRIAHIASVADEEAAITEALRVAGKRADFIFITGGLGPTKDDITKKVFAAYFKKELVPDQPTLKAIGEYFTKRGRELSEINRSQAMVPKGCKVIRNENGTAPGMWMKKSKKIYISMPGVPYEMKAMMTDTILPRIRKNFKLPHIYHKTILTQGIGESDIATIIEEWENSLAAKNIKLAYLPQPGMVKLRLSSFGDNETSLRATVDAEAVILTDLLNKYVFGTETYGEETPTIEKLLSDLLRERKETLALAESCTGGYVSSLITAIPGASDVFKGAIVPYTNLAKHSLLQVNPSLFETVGAVSRECVEQLAQNALQEFDSHYAISISGIAGPTGGTEEKPVGTVWIAVASREKVLAMKFRFGDNRQRNIISTAHAALNMLRKFILKQN